jgi:hypothetical protein
MNAQLSCPLRPALEAGDVEKTRELGHQPEQQPEETALPRPGPLKKKVSGCAEFSTLGAAK